MTYDEDELYERMAEVANCSDCDNYIPSPYDSNMGVCVSVKFCKPCQRSHIYGIEFVIADEFTVREMDCDSFVPTWTFIDEWRREHAQ